MISERLKSSSDEELLNMVNNHSQFQKSFVIAAYQELKNRGIEFDDSSIKTIIDNIVIQKEEEAKRQQEHKNLVRNMHPNIKKGVVLIIAAMVVRAIQMAFMSSGFTLGAGPISFNFSDIFNVIILGVVAYAIRNGEIWVRYLCLIGFIIGNLIDIFFVGVFLSDGDIMLSLLLLVGIIIKSVALIYLFNKKTNIWYKEIKNKP